MQLNFAVIFDMMDLIRSDAMKVFKWGNSLAVRLPTVIVEAFGLKAGDDVDVRFASERHAMLHKEPTGRNG